MIAFVAEICSNCIMGNLFCSVIFCEAVAIYGVIVAIILQTKLESVPSANMFSAESMRAGFSIFASGIIVGFANLVCGYVNILWVFAFSKFYSIAFSVCFFIVFKPYLFTLLLLFARHNLLL